MTDWSYYEAARRFQRVLVAAGIDSALKARGVMVSWLLRARRRPASLSRWPGAAVASRWAARLLADVHCGLAHC